ncbi:hypothetical protein PSTT_16121 [Puccinia striiformis]|uniref:Uncharacterized protein n=2 Tax=Puccinia striiformis TaxID=27350 RepID=A0A0L0V699_9BASI|nr:hypothetical protein PSTG_11818 [Puccinia striiformis f. sp. tritici PST-78]POV95644.1 hypothetical protein PSTT_16121 [Puccinia striiformis]
MEQANYKLYKSDHKGHDVLEFDLVQKLSLEFLNSQGELDGELDTEEVKAKKDQNINQAFEDAELGQQIKTYKHLLHVLIPELFNNFKASNFLDGTTLMVIKVELHKFIKPCLQGKSQD